jgi:hypothetical protein
VSKLDEFKSQLVEVDREIAEKQEFREYLLKRMDEESEKENNQTYTLSSKQLHKLLCVLENSTVPESAFENNKIRKELIELQHDLIWDIAEKFDYDMNEGSIDPKTFEFYTFKSRW